MNELTERLRMMKNAAADAAADRIEKLERQNAEMVKSRARYEKVRLLNPRMFTELCRKNITGGVPFDDLIDALEPDLSNFDDVMSGSSSPNVSPVLNQGGE